MNPEQFSPASKRAELLGTTGVFLIGLGAGAWLGDMFSAYAVELIIGGALIHAVAMFGKHRLDLASRMTPPLWYRMLYWICWLLLGLLALWLALSR